MAETFANRTQNAKEYIDRYRQNAYEDLNQSAQEKLAEWRYDEQEKAEREHGEVEAGEAEIAAPAVLGGLYGKAKGIYGNIKDLHSKISDVLNKKPDADAENEDQDELPRPAEGDVGHSNADLNEEPDEPRGEEETITPDTIEDRDVIMGGRGAWQLEDDRVGSVSGPLQKGPTGDLGRNIGAGEEDGLTHGGIRDDLGGGAVDDTPSVASNLSDRAGNLIRGAESVAPELEETGASIAGKIGSVVGEAALDALPGVGEAALAIQGLVSIGEGIAHLFHHPDKAPAVPPPTPLAVPHNITSKFSTALPENGIHEDMAGASSAAF